MKYIISFFITLNCYSAPIRIFHEQHHEFAHAIKTIMVRDYLIPEELIEMKSIEDCTKLNRKGKLDLCLKNNGDLKLVSVDREFVNDSLKIFRAP
jgi:hypothetical protein